jgi:C-terminal processing protease CtpA/Prc
MIRALVILLLFITTIGCEKALFSPDLASSDPYKNFDYLWEQVDKKYSYFGLKDIDWQSIKSTYRSQLTEDMTEEALFDVLSNMLNELKDDHTNLISPFNVSVYTQPVQENLNYHPTTVWEHYVAERKITGSFQHGIIDGKNIAYIRYSSFMNTPSHAHLSYLISLYGATNGLILDLRQNGGGNSFNVPIILERFNDKDRTVGYFITRNGKNHDDFGPQEPFNLLKSEQSTYLKPVAVLIDKGSYSATTMFAVATKSMPNLVLIGDTTGGGGGLPNGGELPNGWTYRFSISQLLDINGNNYAENGVPPDIYQLFDWSDLTKDEIVDRALLELGE